MNLYKSTKQKWVIFCEYQHTTIANTFGNVEDVKCICDSELTTKKIIKEIADNYRKQGKEIKTMCNSTWIHIDENTTIVLTPIKVPYVDYEELTRMETINGMDNYKGERFAVAQYSWEDEPNPDDVHDCIIRIGDNRETPDWIDNQIFFDVENINQLKELTKPNNGNGFRIVGFIEYDDNAIEDYNEIMERETEVDDDELIMRLIVAVLAVKRMLTEDKDNGIDLAKCDLRSPNGEIYWFPETLSQFKQLLNELKEEFNGKNTEDCSFLDVYENGKNEAYFIDVMIDIIRNSKGNIVDFIA